MKQPDERYVLSFQTERFHRGMRYHWMVCLEEKPDELVSWGNSPTQELAEKAAQQEVSDLSTGLSQGGKVASTSYMGIHRC